MSDDFLSRWSRRKRGEEPEPAEDTAPAVESAEPTEAPPEESDDEILARLGLKHPDALARGDDFAAFLKAEVPRHLKSLALRRLWRSNPALACLDGLNDYDTDFTGTGVGAGGLKTSYQVGRGILKGIVDAEAEEARVADASSPALEPEDATLADADEAEDAAAADTRPASPADRAQDALAGKTVQGNDPPDTPRATRRRMVFRASG